MLLDFDKSKSLLEKYNLPLANCKLFLANETENAITFAKKISFPVVLKGYNQNLLHRTEEQGVITDIKCSDDLVKGFEKLGKFENILVQKQISGLELFIGAKNDVQFGPIILFGLGGIFVEALNDIAIEICPINQNEALEMIKATKAFKILGGARGRAYNLSSLQDILQKISLMMHENESLIEEMDFNPVFINETGAMLADFKLIAKKP